MQNCSCITEKEFLAWTDDAEVTLLYTVLSKIVWYLIIKFTSLIIKLNRKAELNLPGWLEVFIVPVCSIWILISVLSQEPLKKLFLGIYCSIHDPADQRLYLTICMIKQRKYGKTNAGRNPEKSV